MLIFWRLATTIQMYYLHVGSKPQLSKSQELVLEQKYGRQLGKMRPWGVIIPANSNDSREMFDAFSRTSLIRASNDFAITHQAHGTRCKLNRDGMVEIAKAFRVPYSLWISNQRKFKIATTFSEMPIACRHGERNCDSADRELIEKLQLLKRDTSSDAGSMV